MANVCIGDGMTTDSEGRLTLDTPAWPLLTPADGPFSQPLGLAADGRVYAPPRQLVVNTLFTGATNPALDYDAPDTTDPDGFSRTFTLALSNPDPARRLHGVALIEIDCRFLMQPASEVWVAAVGGNEANRWRNDAGSTRAPHIEFTRNITVNVPPGASQTLSWDVSTGLTSGIANLTFIFQTVRIMAVSSQPI